MTDEYLEEIRASMAESPVGLYAAELLAEDRLRATAKLVQAALENNHMAMVVLAYGRELGLFRKE